LIRILDVQWAGGIDMEKERILLTVGCSHAAGSEIDGHGESVYNRENCFGAKLAERLHRKNVNRALGGLSNQGIARSAIRFVDRQWDPDTQDLMVLVSWTESTRIELPVKDGHRQYYWDEEILPYKIHTNNLYHQINTGWTGGDQEEREWLAPIQSFMVDNTQFLQTLSAMQVLLLQNFFKVRNIPYLMCNTMHMFTPAPHLSNYLSVVDTTHYYNPFDNTRSFYWYYRNLGYENVNAQWWHHDIVPHELYAQELYNFYQCSVNSIETA